MVYVWVGVLFLANLIAWIGTVFTLPGNWVIVGFAALYAHFLPQDMEPRISWTFVAVLLGLATLGEVVEFVAGAAGAAKQGGSRRGIVYSIVGAFVGSIAGAFVTLPIPVIGPIIGAVGGGAVGAFAGAWIGEAESLRTSEERLAISKGALFGRLWGTLGKLLIGLVMLALVTADSLFDFPASK